MDIRAVDICHDLTLPKVACCVFCDMSHGVNSLTGSWLRLNIVALPIAMEMRGVDVCHDMRLPKVACCVFCDMSHLVNSLTGSWLRSNIALPIAMEMRGVDGSHERTLEYVRLQSHVVCLWCQELTNIWYQSLSQSQWILEKLMIETRGLNKLSTESILDFREYLCILCRYYTDGRNIKKSELQPTKLEYLVSISLLRRWQDRFCTVEVQARICKIDSASLQNRACRFGIEFPPCKIGPATGVRLWRSTRYMSIYRVDTRL